VEAVTGPRAKGRIRNQSNSQPQQLDGNEGAQGTKAVVVHTASQEQFGRDALLAGGR